MLLNTFNEMSNIMSNIMSNTMSNIMSDRMSDIISDIMSDIMSNMVTFHSFNKDIKGYPWRIFQPLGKYFFFLPVLTSKAEEQEESSKAETSVLQASLWIIWADFLDKLFQEEVDDVPINHYSSYYKEWLDSLIERIDNVIPYC
ncbi:hypothetical protein K501DRAFT_278023 [Backusella circina FSU 941]|nr:hypothetical protein K501DRAFT_278023 [Backusella circina FSU 941]